MTGALVQPTELPSTPRRLSGGVGAVVVGGDYQGLGIVRSLGRRKIPVCVIDDEHSIARFSRYTTRAVRTADLRDEGRTVEAILALGRRLGLDGWVLYPTREETVAAFSRHRDPLRERFRVPTPSWSSVQWAWDKHNTYRLAADLGIPTPRTWHPRSADEAADIDAPPPFVVKPTVKERFVYATKAKAWQANDHRQLRVLFQRAIELTGPGGTIVQELVPGDGSAQFAYCAFYKDGRAIATMVARRTRQHPPDFGRASTFAETVENPAIEQLSERFLRAIGYYGLVEVEYKLDRRDGRLKLLDVNARTWGYHGLAQRAGVDFPYLLFADQLGERVATARARSGVRWVRLVTDVPTAAREVLARRLDWRAYVRSVAGADVEAVFDRRDPLPFFTELAMLPYLIVKRGF